MDELESKTEKLGVAKVTEKRIANRLVSRRIELDVVELIRLIQFKGDQYGMAARVVKTSLPLNPDKDYQLILVEVTT